MILIAVLCALLTLFSSVIAWRLSGRYQCASIADIFWPLHHIVSMTTMLLLLPQSINVPTLLTIILVLLWGFRLATHLSIRQAGAPEDARYQTIRSRIGTDFDRKSLYLIFAPQALMAWFISLMLFPALTTAQWNAWAFLGLVLAGAGLIWEITADLQLSAFLKKRASVDSIDSRVLDRGLWSFSRHPNYFGEWVFWLGHGITAITLDNHFLIVALPAMSLLTFLLLRFTGVSRSEPAIAAKRPDYAAYQARVPAVFPNPKTLWSTLTHSVQQRRATKHQLGWWLLLCNLTLTSLPEVANAQSVHVRTWLFDVRIDEKEVGFHEFTLRQGPRGYTMDAKVEFRYKVLGMTIFSYEHAVTERYDKELCLQSISSQTKTNGKSQSLNGSTGPSGFVLAGQSTTTVTTDCILTFAYWTPKLLSQSQILNGQTGDLVDIEVAPIAKTKTDGTQRYALKGDKIDVHLAYDELGNWLTLDSILENGRSLTYRLRN